ncbi:MAG: Asp-tRNA(Asn)/Glu-tRNA(Gln) amidotransferase subunit GatC [Planctomycetes bacterium]|nr:Asp-tRNA(Asn)/Glu-tRNA(Gln) amidotransferase subunit GatC [Planctomycetota bacterium]
MAANLDAAAVRHVAHLARLNISDAEVALYAEQLSRVLGYMEQLGELATDGIAPTAHPLPVVNVFRDDVPVEPWDPQRALQNAPQRQGAFFRVPKVLDQDSA